MLDVMHLLGGAHPFYSKWPKPSNLVSLAIEVAFARRRVVF